ncbi:MAG TPA: helix-turn-helix domain-containing protein [Steroidobacteraceae bacterium]|nr:helix-turn-helix domain-containing protein [Steroidobacteraceae bacterium]
MTQREVISTDTVQPRRRVMFWNDMACDSLTPQAAEPYSPPTFGGRMVRADIGDLRFVEFNSEPAVVRRSREHIARSNEDNYLIRFQLGSESVCSQGGADVLLKPGDFALCDSERPYQLAFAHPVSILTLRVSKNLLQRYVGSPENLVSVPVSGSRGAGHLASRVIREIWESADEPLVPAVTPRVANVVLELIASAYVGVARANVDRSCLSSAQRLRILDFIEQSLGDPDLSPAMVAQALKISTRHVHRVFALDGNTVARYILRRRLEKCRTALLDPLLAGLSLTHISSEYGFRSLPHFSRLFREEFGVAPREYRRSRTTMDLSPPDK